MNISLIQHMEHLLTLLTLDLPCHPQCAVNAVAWSPFNPDMFLSCSSDCTIQLWKQYHRRPLLTFMCIAGAVQDIKWSQRQAAVFGAVSDRQLEIWDLSLNMWVGLCWSCVWLDGSSGLPRLTVLVDPLCDLQPGASYRAAYHPHSEHEEAALLYTDRLCPGRRQQWCSECLSTQEPPKREQPGKTETVSTSEVPFMNGWVQHSNEATFQRIFLGIGNEIPWPLTTWHNPYYMQHARFSIQVS